MKKMATKRKPSLKPSQSSEVKEGVQYEDTAQKTEEEVIKDPRTEVTVKAINTEKKNVANITKYYATGKFYAKDGFVIGKDGKIVSKKMEQSRAEDVANKFNR